MTRFASLGSGSKGNGLVFQAGSSAVLLDCGFPVRDTVARLARLGLVPSDISGIVVTHEHSDHSAGVFPLAKRFAIPVWMTFGTLHALQSEQASAPSSAGAGRVAHGVTVNLLVGEAPVDIGDVRVSPYTVPHDAREPVQFVLSDGARRLGVLTDTGCSTPHIEMSLDGCDALVLETNHDLDLLRRGPYPEWLKERVAGRLGHLDNAAAGELLGALDCSRLRHLVAAHLSEKNNTPALAREALVATLGCDPGWLQMATQAGGTGWLNLSG
jgi:phosphoribosyl 1,2-cyclic phosphodiesterase